MSRALQEYTMCTGGAHVSRLPNARLPRGLPRGEVNGCAKLNEGNVRFIFELRGQGWSQARIAAEFGVGQTQISRILARKRWAHLASGVAQCSEQ